MCIKDTDLDGYPDAAIDGCVEKWCKKVGIHNMRIVGACSEQYIWFVASGQLSSSS